MQVRKIIGNTGQTPMGDLSCKEENRVNSYKMPAALILAGGRGVRLRPLTDLCPKPLLPVGGKAVIFSIVEDLYLQGVRRCVILTGYRGGQIKDALEGRFLGMELIFIEETHPMGSAGCLLAAKEFAGDRFFVVCADCCGTRDYEGMLSFHLEKGGLGSIFLSRVEDPVEYGLVRQSKEGRIEAFTEKPAWSEAFTDLANTGVYLFEKEVFDYIPSDRPSDFGKDVFPALLAEGKALYGFEDGRFWKDMGDHRAYLLCNLRASGGKTVYGKDCRVQGATISSSLLFDRVQVGKGSVIKGAIIGNDCIIGENCILEQGCVLGDGCLLEDECHLKEETVLQRGTRLKKGHVCADGCLGLARFFEEGDLFFDVDRGRSFYVRLGYAFARGAGGRIGLMHDGSERCQRIYDALVRGACLSGSSPAKLGRGFYTMASCCALYGNFSLTALVTAEKTGGERILLFDSSGLSACGRTVRKIRDAFGQSVLCGRIGRPYEKEGWAASLYEELILEGVPCLVGLTVGMDKGTAATDFMADLLARAGARVVPEKAGRIRIYVSPDGRRCTFFDDGGQRADFWHLAAIVLSDCLRQGARVRALPERVPGALFDLVEKHCPRPQSFALCASAPCSSQVRDGLLNQRFLYDGCFLAVRCLAIIYREGVNLSHLMHLLPAFAAEEGGIDCSKEEKLRYLLSFGGEPTAEGVKLPFERGWIHVRARAGRGLWLMAEAAKEEDARDLLQRAREKVLSKKGEGRLNWRDTIEK